MGILLSQAKEKSMKFKEKFGRIKKKIDIRFGCEMSWTVTDQKDFLCKKKSIKEKKGKMMKKEKGNKESGFRKSEKKKKCKKR